MKLPPGFSRRPLKEGTVPRLQRSLTQTARFHRRLLYIFALLLSAMIGCATSLFISSTFTHFFETKQNTFEQNHEYVQEEVVRLSSRLTGMVDLYQNDWSFHLQEKIPLNHYLILLKNNNGITTTSSDLTVTPFLIAAKNAELKDVDSLDTMLHILRRISASSAFDVKRDITVHGLLYSSDKSFAAVTPVILSRSDGVSVIRAGAADFINHHVDPIDSLISAWPAGELRTHRVIWMSIFDRDQARWTVEIILPIFHGVDHVATIAAQIPTDQLDQYFISATRPTGFFLLRADGTDPLAARPRSGRDAHLLRTIQTQKEQILHASGVSEVLRDGLTFYIVQRIDGPGWISVYAFDWRDLLGCMTGRVASAAILCIGSLALLWLGVSYFDRRVARPFERDARKLVEAESFNRSIIDTAPVGIAVFDVNSSAVVLENTVAKHLLGNDNASLNATFYRHALASQTETLQTPPPLPGKTSRQHKFMEQPWTVGSRKTYIGVASSSTRFCGRDAILFGLVDITERKASEAMLIEARRTADLSNKDKSMFLAMMSHEIRTPLYGAKGHLELLAASSLAEEQRARVTVIQRSFEALQSLINDLLDTTRIEINTLTINPQPMYLNRIVEHCAQHFMPVILGRSIALHCYTDPELDRQVEADDHRIMQILQNLVSNAAKFTQHGSITLSTRLLRFEQNQLWARIEVSDTGIGIPSALQAMVFKPLRQADASISRRYGGSGLGLFLCRNLTGLMGGTLTLQSEPDVGSIFSIDIPLGCCLDDAQQDEPTPLSGMSIGLLADNRRLFDMLKTRLERWGAIVIESSSSTLDVRVIASTNREPGPEYEVAARGRTVLINAHGPLTPARFQATSTVSIYSSDALLSALLDLSRPDEGNRLNENQYFSTRSELDILIAEDDPVNRLLLNNQLQALGYAQIRSAQDGREALNMWIEHEPDVVLTDLSMPYLDGTELLEEIRKRNPNAYVIVTTATGSSDLAPELAQSFSGVLHKPMLLADLHEALSHIKPSKDDGGHASGQSVASHLALVHGFDPELYNAFLESWAEERDVIRNAITSRDRNGSRRRLHRLQGALLAMGLDGSGAECLNLQTLCDRGDWSSVAARFEALVAEMEDLGQSS